MTTNYKILIADDETQCVEAIYSHLSQSGYEIITAFDGAEALEKIKNENPDIIILDINMPKMNGFEVLEQIRSNPPSAKWQPVIIISTKDEFDSLRKGYELEADYYVTKPFNLDKISNAVNIMISLLPLRKTK
ncbi:MAG: response regulator [Candidatus Omnitrophota bacterium]